MAVVFVEATRTDGAPRGRKSLVNMANVAWMDALEDGGTRIFFSIAPVHEQPEGGVAHIAVKESPQSLLSELSARQSTRAHR
jgi:hypothetical protein